MAKVSILQFLRLLKKARALSDVPDICDWKACRHWVRDLVEMLGEVSGSARMPVDDGTLRLLGTIAENKFVWYQFHQVLFKIVTHEPLSYGAPFIDMRQSLESVAEKLGHPCDAMAIAELVNELSEVFPDPEMKRESHNG